MLLLLRQSNFYLTINISYFFHWSTGLVKIYFGCILLSSKHVQRLGQFIVSIYTTRLTLTFRVKIGKFAPPSFITIWPITFLNACHAVNRMNAEKTFLSYLLGGMYILYTDICRTKKLQDSVSPSLSCDSYSSGRSPRTLLRHHYQSKGNFSY